MPYKYSTYEILPVVFRPHRIKIRIKIVYTVCERQSFLIFNKKSKLLIQD